MMDSNLVRVTGPQEPLRPKHQEARKKTFVRSFSKNAPGWLFVTPWIVGLLLRFVPVGQFHLSQFYLLQHSEGWTICRPSELPKFDAGQSVLGLHIQHCVLRSCLRSAEYSPKHRVGLAVEHESKGESRSTVRSFTCRTLFPWLRRQFSGCGC